VREWSYSSTIFGLGTRWRLVVRFTPLPLYPRGKSSSYSLDRRLGGHQNRSGPCGEQKHLALPGHNPGCLVHNPSLYRMRYPDSKAWRKPTEFWDRAAGRRIEFRTRYLEWNPLNREALFTGLVKSMTLYM
jgi:hypothetical protein